MTTNKAYLCETIDRYCESRYKIHITDLPFKALSIELNDRYLILIDLKQIASSAEMKFVITHELGHIETGSFHSEDADFITVSKNEEKANRWSIEKLLPSTCLKEAAENGYSEIWEIAELYDLTEQFVKKAFEYYKVTGEL